MKMGICPRCGSFVDEGEPYCPYCSYMPGNDSDDEAEMIVIDGNEYRRSDVEDVLRDYAYDFYDLDNDLIDEEDWEDILEDLRFK
jgi:RNA polymerase subunit RPABC4/transcription elongation factor Spt4